MEENYSPPFTPSNRLVNLAAEISAQVAVLNIANKSYDDLRLRRENRIKSIHSSLAIENNTLTIEQVTAVIQGKPVIAPPKDILEAKNAFSAYELIGQLEAYSIRDVLKAHSVMLNMLIDDAGRFRTGEVGVFSVNKESNTTHLIHQAPPAHFVYSHIENLFGWLKKTDIHPLIASSIFHYEFEFIHPFADGNGRMGRLWQTVLLAKWQPVFAWLPIESMIRERQQEYYQCISETTLKQNGAIFAEFMLELILEAVKQTSTDYDNDHDSDYDSDYDDDPVERLLHTLGNKEMSTPELMKKLGLTHVPNFRKNYLNPALERGLIERTIPDKPKSRNQRYRKLN